MKWMSIELEKPPLCEDILFTEGMRVYKGWQEVCGPLEELAFIDSENYQDRENITHWMYLPKLPGKNDE